MNYKQMRSVVRGKIIFFIPYLTQADLYIYHMWDYHTPMEEIIEGLNNAVKAGKTRYVGISNCYAWQLAKANFYARENGFAEFISVQGHYNLIAREEEREMIPFCEDQGIAGRKDIKDSKRIFGVFFAF